MSWDRINIISEAKCPCGCGKIIKLHYREDDDWNRSREKIVSEEIKCPMCASKYHIEHLTHSFFQPSWKGNGTVDIAYCVPNGQTLQYNLQPRNFIFADFEEKLVADNSEQELKRVLEDMQRNKYSTRLQMKESCSIVFEYKKRFKSQKLSNVIPFVKSAIDNYDNFEWTKERIQLFKENEEKRIQHDKNLQDEALKDSLEIDYQEVKRGVNVLWKKSFSIM